MSAQDYPSRANDTMIEELVSYLDGELDADRGREVERRLSRDADYRRKLRQLQQSWDLLDRLPRADVDHLFTQSTVAMVAVAAANDVEQRKTQGSRRKMAVWWLGSGSVAAAFLAGYLLVSSVADRQNKRLLRDLPIIERLDEYRYADNIEFLRMLDREGLFAEEEIDDEM